MDRAIDLKKGIWGDRDGWMEDGWMDNKLVFVVVHEPLDACLEVLLSIYVSVLLAGRKSTP